MPLKIDNVKLSIPIIISSVNGVNYLPNRKLVKKWSWNFRFRNGSW